MASNRHGGERAGRLDLASSENPDLILMDMSLPIHRRLGSDAPIESRRRHAKIPVIALTAHAMVQDKEKALAAGCDDFDTKPVELPRLLEKINSLLQRWVTARNALRFRVNGLPTSASAPKSAAAP